MARRDPDSRVDRRRFLEAAAGIALSGSALIASCAPKAATLRLEPEGSTITLPRADAPELDAPGGVVLIQATGVAAPIAVRRAAGGELLALLTVCTHKGCHVRPLAESFECPCHGSRYAGDGSVREGPATRPLRRFPVRETETAILIEVTE